MKIILKIVVAGLICLFLNSCLLIPGRSRYYAKPVAGRVIDKKTGKGIAGAKIEYFPDSSYTFPERICYTDKNGFFMLQEIGFTATCSLLVIPSSIEFPSVPFHVPGYVLRVSADGYDASITYADPPEIFMY